MPEPNLEPELIPSRPPSPPEDIAAAMGFSSFGAKPNPPKKKRKLADPNSEGSGSNNTPLGLRTRKPDGLQAREEEEEVVRGQGRSKTGLGLGGVQGQAQRHEHRFGGHEERAASTGLQTPDPLAAEALDETAGMLLETGQLPQYLDWSQGSAEGGPQGDTNWRGKGRDEGRVGGCAGEEMRRLGTKPGEGAASHGLPPPDALAAEALDETAGMLLETGQLPQYLDWGQGFAEGGPHDDGDDGNWKGRKGRGGGQVGGGAGEEMRRQGRRGDGEWDWQALRKGMVVDERGDVAFYDGSFVEDPWRGLSRA